MCHTLESSPPMVPLELQLPIARASGAAPTGQRITLTSQDGTQFAAYETHPLASNGAGVVILPDVRGLYSFYETLAERFATVGVAAVVIDYFGRTAGVSARDDAFEYMPHVQQTKPEQVAQDVAAAIAQLRTHDEVRAIFTTGFCFGGANSLQQAANGYGLSGVIAFYGPPTAARFGAPAPIDRIGQFQGAVLGLYGGADPGIPTAEVQRFDEALTAANIQHEIVIYPDAPHSFFDRKADTFHEEADDAWRRVVAFIDANTPKQTI